MKFAICDDAKIFHIHLRGIIERRFHGTDEPIMIDTFLCGEDLLAKFYAGKYDVIFLDIQMKLLNGLQTAERIRKTDRNVVIAFHTSLDVLDTEMYDVGNFVFMHKGQSWEDYRKQLDVIFEIAERNSKK